MKSARRDLEATHRDIQTWNICGCFPGPCSGKSLACAQHNVIGAWLPTIYWGIEEGWR